MVSVVPEHYAVKAVMNLLPPTLREGAVSTWEVEGLLNPRASLDVLLNRQIDFKKF
jgi:hypothetical protein